MRTRFQNTVRITQPDPNPALFAARKHGTKTAPKRGPKRFLHFSVAMPKRLGIVTTVRAASNQATHNKMKTNTNKIGKKCFMAIPDSRLFSIVVGGTMRTAFDQLYDTALDALAAQPFRGSAYTALPVTVVKLVGRPVVVSNPVLDGGLCGINSLTTKRASGGCIVRRDA